MGSNTDTNPIFVLDHDDPITAAAAATATATDVNNEKGSIVPSSASSIADADAVIITKNPATTLTITNSITASTATASEHVRSLDEMNNASSFISSSVACDESLCISAGHRTNFNDALSFTCYSDSSSDLPMMCADGYIPQIIQEDDSDQWNYFTCCPPNLSSYVNITRHCSDPIIRDKESNNNAAAVCIENPSQPHLRPMKISPHDHDGGNVSFVCCDSRVTTTTNFLNTTECLPYIDANYYPGWASKNSYGFILPMFCNHSDIGYIYPNHTAGEGYFECCKSEQHVGPFIVDSGFKGTVYPQIILSLLASMFCTTLILALLVPFVKHLLRTQSSSTTARTRARAHTTATPSNGTSTSTRSEFSSYNLYLLYLALPDLVLNIYLFVMYSSYAMQIYNPNFTGLAIAFGYFNKGWAFEGAFILRYVANTLLLRRIPYVLFLIDSNILFKIFITALPRQIYI